MPMKRLFVSNILLLLSLLPLCLSAQEPLQNHAFASGESVDYIMKFNWGPIWINVGTAEWRVADSKYKGTEAYKVSLKTLTNKRADRYFVLRDTMAAYVTHDLVPLRFQKSGREGKRYKRDYADYSYANKKCNVSTFHHTQGHKSRTSKYSGYAHAYDMISMMLRARSFDPSKWKKGHRIRFMMAEGSKVAPQVIVYRGKKVVELEEMKRKYNSLVFSFNEIEDGKEKEIVRFYISDDENHLPIRLDMNLNFGSAKAFMTSATGLRHAETSLIKN